MNAGSPAGSSERRRAAYVSISSEVHPEFREYERTSTTTLNAYLQPKLACYLGDLGARVAAEIGDVDVVISHSAGGLMSLDTARRFPIRTALSGPAAGVLGAIEVATQAGFPDVVTFDVGGTSADVALIQGLQPGQSRTKEVGGWPVRLPAIDISTVGAGGGSIVYFDRDGGLRVGPRSAGALPGPACYGLGGVEPTVTDANLVLGRLSPGGLLDGRLDLQVAAARRAFEPIAQRLGFTVEPTAYGVIEIVVANMARVIRTVSVERGFDPRELTLLAYGGAGPLHARAVAASLEIGTVVVPAAPGLLCAAGLIASPLKEDFLRTARIPLDTPAASARIDAVLADLHGLARAWFVAERIRPDSAALRIVLDLRYAGQNFELEVVLPDPGLDAAPHAPDGDALRACFFEQHDKTYGFHNPDAPVEVVNCRVAATGSRHPAVQASAMAAGGEPAAPVGSRAVWFDGAASTVAAVFRREQLARGQTIEGPAIIEQMDTTTILMRGDHLRVDDFGNLVIEIGR